MGSNLNFDPDRSPDVVRLVSVDEYRPRTMHASHSTVTCQDKATSEPLTEKQWPTWGNSQQGILTLACKMPSWSVVVHYLSWLNTTTKSFKNTLNEHRGTAKLDRIVQWLWS